MLIAYYTTIDGVETKYTTLVPFGITQWNSFEYGKEYRMKRCDIAYLDGSCVLDGTVELSGYIEYDKYFELISFINGRVTQLSLKEVIRFE